MAHRIGDSGVCEADLGRDAGVHGARVEDRGDFAGRSECAAAGISQAVATYYMTFVPRADEAGLLRYFLTASVIGVLYKENASISGAEVGCQGEVGVACSMAAGGLVAAQGGSNEQVECAAEIGMEHNLGMTFDPIGGVGPIPFISPNSIRPANTNNAFRT